MSLLKATQLRTERIIGRDPRLERKGKVILQEKNRVQDYFKSRRVSNSLLGLLSNPKWIRHKLNNPDTEDEETKYFRIGSALDCLLTSPELWDDEFEVVDANRPYGLMAKFIDNLPSGLTPDSPEEDYQEAYDKSGYKMKLSRVISNFWDREDCVGYYTATRDKNKEKSLVSRDELDIVENMKNLILANAFTHDYFIPSKEYIEVIHQLPIYFEYEGVDCKCLMDGVLINHRDKYIQPFDLKTIGKGLWNFPTSFYQYGYYRQAAMYTYALKLWLSENRPELDDYDFKLFQFIVVESKISSSAPAIIYQCSENDIKVGMDGGCLKWGDKCLKGFKQLLDDWKWHLEKDYWELPREIYEAEGKKDLDIFDYI